ncbi:Complement C5 [Merluccius polli]|uniref:Complement C5 n=1 Tax=Merluccius polli TaxID=89951 RepID=A0AA47M604_MERPO|nr:Complement C5 [Merluccius polli]
MDNSNVTCYNSDHRLGVWSIHATYSEDFDTKAVAAFQVKEYVLPSIAITVKPEKNFISTDNFQRFAFRISASYVHGAPVKGGVVFIRYGYISGKKEPVIIPNLLTRKLLSSSGVVDVTEDIKACLAKTGDFTLESLNGKYLYITVLVEEYRGGISEETEYTSVKFLKSPYSLHLISTPRFIKPGLSYNIKMLVRDHLGQPQAGIPVNLVDKCIIQGMHHPCGCTGFQESNRDGFFDQTCNINSEVTMAVLKFETADPALSAEGQASFTLEAPVYSSPNRRYLYINPPGRLKVGHWVYIQVFATMPNHLRAETVNYLVLSKGKVLAFGVGETAEIVYKRNQLVRFKVTPEMTPSIRLVIYYLVDGEVVADSLWIDVEGKCVNGLQTKLDYRGWDHRPESHLLMDVSTNQDGFLALSAVDTAIFPLRRNHKDPLNMVLRHIEHSDQGCGGGGGKDAQGVFQLAGLTLLTNAITQQSQSDGTCQDVVRAKRSLTEDQRNAIVAGYENLGPCCQRGFRYVPRSVTCEQYAMQSVDEKHGPCRKALQDCCEINLKHIQDDLQHSQAVLMRTKRSLTEEQRNATVDGYKNLGPCCQRGFGYVPRSVTCEQYAMQSVNKKHGPCRKALQDCCERNLEHIPDDLQHSPAVLMRKKRSLTEEQRNATVAGYKNLGPCCQRGFGYVPSSVTCEQYAMQSVNKKHGPCRKALQDCCERNLEHIPDDLQHSRVDMGSDLDTVPSMVRSYFPESWLWEVQPTREKRLSINRTLPHSLTTWEITAVGMFPNGICVQDPVQVSVTLPVSVNIPLPYQLIRGEQLELFGSVYNQNPEPLTYCVTLTVGPEFCLLHSVSVGDKGLRSTACKWEILSGSGVVKAGPFTLVGLQPGEHTLTFTLRTQHGTRDIVQKKLRVVPEGVRKETISDGRLDPKSLYGLEKRRVTLKNRLLYNLVPDSSVERVISISGEIMGELLSVLLDPEGLRKLVNWPGGSVDAGLDEVLPFIHVYRYLEENARWSVLGGDTRQSSLNLRQRIKAGVANVLSYKVKEQPSAYSMWKNGEPSTRLTAKVVMTFGLLKDVILVDYTSLGQSVNWLISSAQNGDGSFKELLAESKRVTADDKDQSVYLTSFVLISLKRATQIRDPALRLQSQEDAMVQAANYISQHALDVKSVYVRAVATYALTYFDLDNEIASQLFDSLKDMALEKGNPVEQRYWQESKVAEWLKPDESSGLTVETTAYVLLTALLKWESAYIKPILTWLTQDQHYGGGFYSTQDIVLTLEAFNEYSKKLFRSSLNMDITVRSGNDILSDVELRETTPMSRPIQVPNYGDITVSTGFGNGVSHVTLKTVYYQTTVSSQNCNFDFNIEISKHNDDETESGLTVLEIQLPTGVQANVHELRQFMDGDIPAVLHYTLSGNMVVIQTDLVPSDTYRCVGFRVRPEVQVVGAANSVFRVYEKQGRGRCEKQFAFKKQDLQRLCLEDRCQCMTGTVIHLLGFTFHWSKLSLPHMNKVLLAPHTEEPTQPLQQNNALLRPAMIISYMVKIMSAVAEGDFMTYRATVVQVLKRADQEFEGVMPGVTIDLVKKATCSSIELPTDAHFLVQGSRGSEVLSDDNKRYRFPLDSNAVLELLPNCMPSSSACLKQEVSEYEEDLLIFGCSNA